MQFWLLETEAVCGAEGECLKLAWTQFKFWIVCRIGEDEAPKLLGFVIFFLLRNHFIMGCLRIAWTLFANNFLCAGLEWTKLQVSFWDHFTG